jgi:hypothetical protein
MRRAVLVALACGLLIVGVPVAFSAVPNPDPCRNLTGKAYEKCRFDRLETKVDALKEPQATVTVTATPTTQPSPSQTPTQTPTSTPTQSPTSTPTAPPGDWPDAASTGVADCGTLRKVQSGGQVVLNEDGQTYQNVELTDETIIRVRADNVTIRCVKMNGTGWFGIDNTEIQVTGTTVDQVDISCLDDPQRIGVLLRNGTLSRANVHNCDHMVNAGGDNLTVKDSYCHHLTTAEVVHADCVQTLGGADQLLIEGNAFYSRDTSDVLLGQEFGDAKNVVIDRNYFGSGGNPDPAYLLYLSGTNTKVTNNVFTRDYTYGHCTLNTTNPVVWEGNTWEDGEPVNSC